MQAISWSLQLSDNTCTCVFICLGVVLKPVGVFLELHGGVLYFKTSIEDVEFVKEESQLKYSGFINGSKLSSKDSYVYSK